MAYFGRRGSFRQQLYDEGSVSRKFVPVLLAEGVPAHVPTPVKGATIYQVETAVGYEALLRLLTDQPMTPMPPLGQRKPPTGTAATRRRPARGEPFEGRPTTPRAGVVSSRRR